MKIIVALLGIFVSALTGYLLTKLFDYLFKIIKDRRWVFYTVAGVFALGFTFMYFVSPYFRDVLKAWFYASTTEQQCFFDARIDNPNGADTESLAHQYITDANTTVSWTPTNCVLDIKAYQKTALIGHVEGKNPGETMIQDVTDGHSGLIELKIFQPGFETASNNIWIEVKP